MNYKEYIKLFYKAENKPISDIIDNEFYQTYENCQSKYDFEQIENDFKKIMLSFVHKEGKANYQFRSLEKQLIRQYLWTKEPLHKMQYDIFHTLFIHYGCKDTYSKDEDDWVNAMSLAISLHKKGFIYIEDDESIKYTKASLVHSVLACKFFRQKGINISVKKGDIKFNNIDVIFNQLDIRARKLGRYLYLFFTKSLIEPLLDTNSGLYRFPISSSYSQNDTILPYGLIFQFAVKYIDRKPSLYHTDEKIKANCIEFLDFSRKYASLFELQGFGHDFEMILMNDNDNLFNKLQKIVYQDNFYKIEQYISNDVFEFVTYLANKFVDNQECCNDISKFIEIIELIKRKSENGLTTFHVNELSNINENFLAKFSFKNSEINQNFKNHTDFDKVNFNSKIFINTDSIYHILHLPFFAISLYRILYSLLEENLNNSSNLSSNIGDYIEDYIQFKMCKKNFNSIHGRKYKVYKAERKTLNINAEQLECDILLESNQYITFIEMKKKELTDIAKKGNILAILNDLALSLLDSQKQANRHMRYISEFDKIKFFRTKTKLENIVELKGREILKISISSLDYLSLHSKDVFHKFMRLLYNQEIKLTDKKPNKDESKMINAFNSSNEKLSKELKNPHSEFQLTEANGFYNSFFLNIFHLVYLINKSENVEEFTTRLIGSRGIILPYRDFYHENIYIEGLKGYNTSTIPLS